MLTVLVRWFFNSFYKLACIVLISGYNNSMIAKAWNYFVNKISRKEEPQRTVILPFARPRPPPIVHASKMSFSIKDDPQQEQSKVDFGFVVSGGEQFSRQVGGSQNDQLAQQLINELRTLEDQLRCMQINTRKVNQSQKECQVFDASRLPQMYKQRQIEKRQVDFEAEYENQIISFLDLKYEKEKENFPLIPKQQFVQVVSYWRDKNHAQSEVIKKNNIRKSVDQLNYRAMWSINHGQWLNDDIINMNLDLMEKQFVRDNIKLLNTYFATTAITKGDAMVLRIIKKQGLGPNNVIILPIHLNKNHWIFAKFDPQTQTLIIYDSLKRNRESYLQDKIFQNLLKFANLLYAKDFQLEVCESFPQQKNGFDCGMFMLSGIRDCLRGQQWSFDQFDMRYKRYQLACEVLKEELMVASS